MESVFRIAPNSPREKWFRAAEVAAWLIPAVAIQLALPAELPWLSKIFVGVFLGEVIGNLFWTVALPFTARIRSMRETLPIHFGSEGASMLIRGKLISIESVASCGPNGEWRLVNCTGSWSTGWRLIHPSLYPEMEILRHRLDALSAGIRDVAAWEPIGKEMGGSLALIPTAILSALAGMAFAYLPLAWGAPIAAFLLGGLLRMFNRAWLLPVRTGLRAGEMRLRDFELSVSKFSFLGRTTDRNRVIHLQDDDLESRLTGYGNSERIVVRQGRTRLVIPCWSPDYNVLKGFLFGPQPLSGPVPEGGPSHGG